MPDEIGEMRRYFDAMLSFASEVLSEGSPDGGYHPVLDVIRLYGKRLQADYLMNVFKTKPSNDPFFGFFNRKKFNIFTGLTKIEWQGSIDLAKDVVLPWPWHPGRLTNAIETIGSQRENEWKQDPKNHRIMLLLPIGLAFVGGGNHSITAGIIQSEGRISPTRPDFDYENVNAYSMAPLFDLIETDGVHYFYKKSGEVISEVGSVELAVIFEVGRRMMELGISY